MTLSGLLSRLAEHAVQLKSDSGDLVIHCDEDLYDEALLSALRRHKPALLTLARRNGDDWWQPACAITPDMLPLVALEETHIASIVGNLPGGAANVQDIYPLAPLQEGMLFHYLLARDGDPYLRDALFGFDSRARLDAFLAALGHVIDRHDILRTAIQWEGVPQPVQVVWYSAPLPVEEIELDAANGDVAQQLHERFDTRQVRLDLNRAPLLRAIVAYDSAQDRWLMLMLFHHLAIDHTALAEVEREVHAYLADAAAQLPEPVPFRNYVAQARLGVSRDEHEAFFREMLGDVDEPTLPFGLRDVRDDGRDIEEAHAVLDAALARRLRVQARQAGVGVASLFHVAWAHVLARASGREDVVFGTVLFGRMQGGGGTERALGMFINTLPVRVDAGRTGTREAVANTHRLLSRLLRHEHASLSLAQRCSGIVAPTPLFSALLNYRHGAASTDSVAWPGIQSLDSSGRTNYPLVLSVDDHDDGLALTVQVTAELDAVRIGAYMTVALDSLATALESNPRRPVKDLPMLPAAEREQVLNAWNRTEADYPRDAALHTLFEAQVERTPEAIALIHEGVALSYAALNARANRIAHALIARGVGPDARVAICVERSIGMVVGLLGILKAGAAYVPLDPAYPPQRLAYMLEDCGPAVLLTQSSVCGTLPVHDIDTLCLDDDRAVFDGMPENNPRHRSLPDHLAYVIYTSGSTGLPKGVTVTHRNGVRLFATTRTDFDFTGDDVWTLFHSFAFDFSVWEIWGALLFGGRLVIVPKTVAQSAEAFYALVCDAGVTVLNQTPGAFRQLIAAQRTGDAAHRLRYVVFGGEALDTAMLKPWYDDRRNAATRLVNMYGITETTVHVSYRPLDAADAHRTGSSPIGRPLADLGAYLLDGAHEPVPRGVAGELYIAGAGLARGYLNRADLTAERFVPDPFGVAGARMYRTGDLARHLPDGNLEYLGRNDDQVKLRGFRIELGEIGARLARCPGVRDAVVIAREDASGDKRLVAYYTGESCETESLREHLLAGLPEYMVPAAYVYLEALPLTPNSKLDRKALPAPDVHAYALKEYEAPRGSVEIALAQIWSKLLDVEQVGRQDNFFELGGHSLLAIGVIERMQRAGWRTDVTALFNAPTLAALAETIDAARREGGTAALHTAHVVPENGIVAGCEAITPEMLPLVALTDEAIGRIVARVPGGAANVQDIYPLAPLQEGVLFHHLLAREGDPYLLNASFAFARREQLDAFFDALGRVIARHDILRTAIQWEGLSEPVQVVWRHAPLQLEEIELDAANGDVAQQLHERFDTRQVRLDLNRAPLLRAIVAYDSAQDRWLMLMLFHHLAIDHTALAEVEREVHAYLADAAAQLPEPVPFRNYVAQARLGVSRDEHEAFFREMLGDVDEPTLPFGLRDVRGDGHDIEEAHTVLDAALARRLRVQARQAGVGVASLFHLAWAHVLARASGREDVVFGTVLFGRMQGGGGTERALGMFINTLPVRVDAGRTGTREAVANTHRLLSRLLRHEHASLSLAQRCSGIVAPTPLFSALLNYRHGAASARTHDDAAGGSGIESLASGERTNYPLVLSVDDHGEDFALTVQTTGQLGADRISGHVEQALDSLADALEQCPGRPVRDLPILPAAERDQVLRAWNRTDADYPRDAALHTLFEAQVRLTPQAVAVEHGARSLTYVDLNDRANRLAHYLAGQGVTNGTRVAILLERSVETVIAEVAVVKCGAVYVPLDSQAPARRQRFMLDDCGAAILLAHSALASPDELSGLRRIDLDTLTAGGELENQNSGNRHFRQSADAAAYIMYTSGSTGKPKGVIVPHRAIMRLVLNCGYARFGSTDRFGFASNPAFDASTLEVWGPLLNGARTVIIDQPTLLSPERLRDMLLAHRVDVLFLTVGLFDQYIDVLLPAFARMRYLMIGGDVLTPALMARVLRQGAPRHLMNLYGPTEATTFSLYCELDASIGEAHTVPIGAPLSNTRAYILDGSFEPVPVSVAGELYVSGDGLAHGYLNRPDLTAERFVPDPFGAAGARMYRTGDLARHLPDGRIEYLGRNDDQVKLRGFRIELGEIGAHLMQHAEVRDAVVIARPVGAQGKRLVAYYTGAAGTVAVDGEALRAHLLTTLPDYMIPAAYVRLEALPLTPNGKLDRKALPDPASDGYARGGYEAPQGEIETAIAGVWGDMLGVGQVGRHDNFFALGGHSLLAIGVIERLQRAGWHTDVTALFNAPTLAALAETIDAARREGGTAALHTAHVVPENGIVAGCEAITPEMLPLVALTDEAIGRIVARVPGGAANVQDIYPLAPLQEGVLFHHLLAREGDPYLLNASFAFARREQLDAFFDALGRVIARHDILRTAIQWEGLSEPVQVVWRHAPLQLEEIELDAANGDVAQQLHERFDTRRLRLDLGAAPLLKLVFAHDATRQRWVLLLIFHHLVADHEAMAEVQREVRAFLAGREADLDEPVPFRNYVARARLGVSRDEHEAFFRDMLGDVDEPTLPFGLRNVQGDGRNVEEATRRIDDDLGRRLRSQARQSGVSAATLFHLAWAVVLGKLSQRDDVVFGTVLFGRLQGQRGASRALGMFINTLPVRMTLGKSVHAAVGETHRVLTQLLRHEHASLALAQQCSGIAVPLPLFSALLNYRHSPAERSEVEEPAWAAIESLGGEERTNYPVALNVDDFGEGFSLTVQTAHELGTASRVCGYMNTALEQLVSALEDEPETVAGRLPVLPASERAVLLEEWCRTEVSSSQERWIHELFEARADASAESAALIHGDAQWSYGEVNARANSLARHLRGLGVGPDTRVALCVERGLGMVVGLLAVLKAGGAYVPLDPTYPAGRLAYMLADSAPVVVLAQAGTQALVSSLDVAQPVLLLDGPDQPWAAQAADNLERPAGLGPDSLAYVIYTSGSTGQPKGVCNTIAGLNNRLGWYADRLQGSASRTAFKTGIGFVDSVTEILETLLAGSALVVFDRLSVMDVDLLAGQIHRFHVTHLVLVPSLLRHLLSVDPSKLSSVEVLVCSGEWLSPVLVRETRARLPHVELLNFYGSSEVNGDATAYDYSSEEALNIDASLIGWPISNTRTYILDKSYEPVPLGVTGELHVTGTGIARGYLNRPDLSAERFVPDPFAAEAGGRMYRTGDLARYRADGAIEYLGRIDFQVKLRGFRIELGEIEAALVAQAGVREAVVLASGEVGDKRLVAYYTLEEGATSGADALRSALAERLSDYMVPSAFVRLERLPLTPNGKLDRAALPTPDRDAYASRGYVPPEGEPEACIAAIWAELLEVERIGRHDNFFELGGHSLLAVRLISRVRRQFDVEVTLQDVFERPVLSDLARTVSTARHSALPPLVAMPRDAGSMLPVSFAQQRMWFLTQLDDVSEAYHIPIGLRLRGALDRAALRAALDRLMTRHEALRTTFRGVDGSPCHMIGPSEQAFALAEQDVPLTDDNDATLLQRLVDEEAHAPFDLAAGPLVRGRLLRFGEQDHVLLLTMHHIVSDGWSLGILTRELGMLYEAFCNGAPDPLAPLPVQYADYAAWQRRCLDGDGLQQQIDYWRRTLAGSRALLTLPTDRPRPPRQDHAGAAIDVTLDAALTAGVRALSRRLGLTPYMTVLTGWAIVLAKLSGQQDVVIGTPVANRTPAEVEGLIGFFVNTLALRIDVDEQKTVQTLLEHVKTRTSEAQSHQSLPFEQVVEVLRPERSLSHSPLFQVMLVWHNLAPAVPTMGNLALSTLSPTRHTAKFDLLLELVETSDTIRGSLEYATALFDRETAQRFDRCLHAVLRAMVAGPDEIVGTVSLLDEADRTRLLAFNTVAPDYPHDRRIDALFEAQAQRTPDGTALVHGTRRLSYAELDARANQLAHALIEAGVNPQTRVAICVERGVEMVIAIIATMKAGAAYVPLDPGYPAQRLDYLLGDCAPAAVLAQTVTREKFGTPAAPVVLLDADAARIARQPVTAPRVSPRSSGDLAYVIYTSGSTGAPKGVAMPHAALANLVHWQRQQSGPDTPRTLQFAALGFDVAFQEMFGTLCAGGELHLIDAGLRLDFHGLFDYLCMQRVQRLYLPYIALQNFAEAVVAAMGARENACELREVIVAGEQLRITPQIAECFRHLPGCRLHNHYGPTESHVVVACALPADVATWPVLPPIGHPLPNVRVHVLDARGQPVPIGASGEIYIGGVQVAHRYLERAALTASQFLPDPFGTEPGARLYRTSDLGRWRADGSLEYLGRDDGQIKLRGFRIEPGEIEAALLSMPGITAVAVVAREDEPGDKRLVAYYTGPAATPGQLRNYLLASLPEHMVPAAYVNLAALPLTPNGKLDDRALPTPAPETVARRSEGNDGAAPVGEIEQKLAALWAQVLKLEYVGRHDNFFELGGHSLLAVRLIELIRKTFAVDIGINTLFTCPNLNQLAKHIEFPLALASPVEMLLPIKVKEAAESTPPTLFCIHPASGLSWSFAGLTRYPRGRFQIYGLQSGGIAEGTSLAPSVEAMSSEYIHVIRTVQPHGPYRLIGWSMGGLVAFEVACQLQALGETVDFVGVLDSFLLYTTQVVPYDEQYTLMNILRTAGCDVGGLDPRQLLTVPEVSRLVRQEGHIFSMLSAAHVGGLVEVRRNNLAITQRYLPKRRFHGTLTHFTATNEPNRVGSPERHWKPYVEGRIRSLPIACTHDDIGTPAYLAPIAELIDAIFEGLE